MSEHDMEFFRMMLEQQLFDLKQRGNEAVTGMRAQENYSPDPLDRAAIETHQGFRLRIKDRESRLIKKIMSALTRIEDGTYGICETCGDDISIGRLMARPMAMHCIECKTRVENLEKIVNY